MTRASALALALLCSACAPATYAYTPMTRGEVPKPAGCDVKIVSAAPSDVSYEEIGTFEYYNGSVPKSVNALRKAIGSRLCEVGGDMLVAVPTAKGEYRTAQAIKITGPAPRPIQ